MIKTFVILADKEYLETVLDVDTAIERRSEYRSMPEFKGKTVQYYEEEQPVSFKDFIPEIESALRKAQVD